MTDLGVTESDCVLTLDGSLHRFDSIKLPQGGTHLVWSHQPYDWHLKAMAVPTIAKLFGHASGRKFFESARCYKAWLVVVIRLSKIILPREICNISC